MQYVRKRAPSVFSLTGPVMGHGNNSSKNGSCMPELLHPFVFFFPRVAGTWCQRRGLFGANLHLKHLPNARQAYSIFRVNHTQSFGVHSRLRTEESRKKKEKEKESLSGLIIVPFFNDQVKGALRPCRQVSQPLPVQEAQL